MATLYKKQGWWYIDYFIDKKRKSKNTRLKDLDSNRIKAENLKREIESLLKAQHVNRIPVTNIMSDEITVNKAIKVFENIHILGKSESHKEIFDDVMDRFKSIVPGTTNVKTIQIEHISQFAVSLKNNLSQATQVTYFQYVASFLNFLKENNYINQMPNLKGIRPKRAKKNIINFDPDDLIAILEEAKARDMRYYNAFMMFLLTGQRPGDVLRLQVRDIDLHHKIIYFAVSKTGSEFKFPIYSGLESFLIHEMMLLKKSRDEYLFPGISVHAIGQAFRKIKRKLGLNKYHYYTLKTFRKNFATDMSELGMTIQEVQALLDHKDPSTTLRYYANVKAEKLKTKIDKLQASTADKSADKTADKI